MSERVSIEALKGEFCQPEGPRDEWDPQVLALIEAVEATRDVYENASDPTTGWYQPDVAQGLARALAHFDFGDAE